MSLRYEPGEERDISVEEMNDPGYGEMNEGYEDQKSQDTPTPEEGMHVNNTGVGPTEDPDLPDGADADAASG